MRLFVFSIVVAALCAPGVANSQGCQRMAPDAEEELTELAPHFYDSAFAEIRGTIIQQLTPADTQYVVRDDSTCQAVIDRAVAHLRASDAMWAAGQEGEFEATVFRFGPYYAVTLLEEKPPITFENGVLSGVSTGRSPLLIYRAADLVRLQTLY